MTNKGKNNGFLATRNKAYARRTKKGITGPVERIGQVAGALGGMLIGGPMGAAMGGALGGAAGNGIGWITGSGDYKVQSNACMVPSFKKNESTIITHREYIMDVSAGSTATSGYTNFDIKGFPINPGVGTTFPWLAQIAANYEEYDILGMVFTYVPTSGESVASANTALGTVIMATEYDPTKPAFQNKQAMENYSFSTSAKPSQGQLHAIECKKVLTPVKQLYVRSGSNTGADLRWTDFANFYIATVGCPSINATLGELWVTYKVRLVKPRLPITVGFGGQIASAYLERSGVTSGAPRGTTTVTALGPLNLTWSGAATLSWTGTPNMNYMVTCSIVAATSVTGHAPGAVSGLTQLNVLNNRTQSDFTSGSGTIIQTVVYYCTCTNVSPGLPVTLNMGLSTTIVGTAYSSVLVTQIDETVQ